MVNKIELYREILEIEPNSKIFFPLARELAVQGNAKEAAAVLTRGITFHPDYLEAKFLLIELLTSLGREQEAQSAFAGVGTMLANYPSLWGLWSREVAAQSKDASLALRFLAASFEDQGLTWAEIMERGLQGSQNDMPDPRPGKKPDLTQATTETPTPAPLTQVTETAPQPAPTDSVTVQPAGVSDNAAAPPLRGAKEVLELADILETPGEKSRPRSSRSRDAAVRTKTMAALLAEQGDMAGALAIYGELLGATSDPVEREDIQTRMEALAPGQNADAQDDAIAPEPAPTVSADTNPAASETDAKPKSPAKLVNLLEALAGRLDARAEG